MTPLRELLRTQPVGPSEATWTCPDGFHQGRGSWGGLAVGALLDAASRVVDDPGMVPRSLTSHLLGPVPPGPARVELRVLRRGSNTATVSALLLGPEADRDGQPAGEATVLADAVIAFGAARAAEVDFATPVWHPVAPPDALAAGWAAVEPVAMPPGVAPEFLDNLEVRPLAGVPYMGAGHAETLGWVRSPDGVVPDAVVLAALADAWWPGTLLPLTAPRPVATLAFALDLVALPADDQPLLHRGRILGASEGYVAETRELWSSDGRLLCHNQQTMVVIR